MSKLSEDFDDKTKDKDTEGKLKMFYKGIEEAVSTLFEKKEAFKSDGDTKKGKGNKIPNLIINLMRKKTTMSKKILKSNSGDKTSKLMKSLEEIEKILETSYKAMKVKKEKEALTKIKRNPKFFYKYANYFSKTRSR